MIKLFNSLSGLREEFVPINPDNITMYVCGPTTYDDIHLGNARTAIVFDVLSRVLRHYYQNVQFVTNFTDIDDKIINIVRGLNNSSTVVDMRKFTDGVIASITDDWKALGVNPTRTVRVTETIQPIFNMITNLLESGHAYIAENGDTVFDISSNPHFGQLTGQTLGEEKDFALWKRRDLSELGFDSPFGYGVMGWSIECSAMIHTYLGDVIDIHGGGIDLKFPHHENEIAQSTCANHTEKLANLFMHSNMVTVDGVKMSKSLGNHITIKDLLGKGYTGQEIRFDTLRTKYSGVMDFTYARLDESVRILKQIQVDEEPILDEQFLNLMSTDLNTPPAIMRLQSLFKQKNYAAVAGGLKFLGLK